ncbi:hypothetical protein BDY21DRAFT_336946 [Lineolata rhizophorae]|uniref:Uncharacterized protein n=1 Tax=Lineolata rhizophorae TaxID=578093 RepID=A0A6A6P7K1_9PEZI|nr:hypothetical protein BDY21DRAFT_336946 [Lineolata rhizophorae]
MFVFLPYDNVFLFSFPFLWGLFPAGRTERLRRMEWNGSMRAGSTGVTRRLGAVSIFFFSPPPRGCGSHVFLGSSFLHSTLLSISMTHGTGYFA